MHPESYNELKINLEKYCGDVPEGAQIIEIGSYDVNGTYNDLFTKWKYTGLDQIAGPNVDLVMLGLFDTGLPADTADIVVCGQVLEHCSNPFKLADEMIRILKPGGWLFIVAPYFIAQHRHPIDCWRFLPDGMRELFPDDLVKCETAYIKFGDLSDCWFVGQKR
jgi:SAM-dependent methyltransferase